MWIERVIVCSSSAREGEILGVGDEGGDLFCRIGAREETGEAAEERGGGELLEAAHDVRSLAPPGIPAHSRGFAAIRADLRRV